MLYSPFLSVSFLSNKSPRRAGRLGALCLGLLLAAAILNVEAYAQTTTLRGFVTDASNGQALELANVALVEEEGGFRGAVTDRDGVYVIALLAPGRYQLVVSFVGFAVYRDTLSLAAGEVRTLNIALVPAERTLDEIAVESERTSGVARNTAGQQTIRPEEIERVPTPDVSGDLASYLTTLPGVVTTGDRGGQLFIRGGEPSQNLVLLDGMLLYQPFHVLGFYSAFPSEIVSRADLYAGGFPSRYGGRVASVLDVAARTGNSRRFAGAASLSPFTGAVRLEGPLLRDRVSFLVTGRRSMVEPWAERVVGERLPFYFDDAFAKVHAELSAGSRLSASAVRTSDRGTLHEDVGGAPPEELRWQNRAFGARYLLLPNALAASADFRLSVSTFHVEQGPQGAPVRASSVQDVSLAMEWTVFGERRVAADIGIDFRHQRLTSELGGLFQNVRVQDQTLSPFALYLEPEFTFGGLRIRPGVRMQLFEVRTLPFVEPRLRLVWERGVHQFSAAGGLYHQELVGLADRRDAASVFTAWTGSPSYTVEQLLGKAYGRDTQLGVWRLLPGGTFSNTAPGQELTAWHGIVGYRTSPRPWLDLSVEGFYKHLTHLLIPEWTPFPRLTTRLQPASGRTFGFDARLELRRRPFYAYVGYGFSRTRYEAEQPSLEVWYGTRRLAFRPPHDRRHQVSALLSAVLFGFDLSVRWHFGSGLPFNQVRAFDGYAPLDGLVDVSEVPGLRRVIYDRPYGGLLPTYHRLDVALGRTFKVRRAEVTLQGSLINAYDRRNLFYLDTFTLRRVDQLPLVPSLGLEIAFE